MYDVIFPRLGITIEKLSNSFTIGRFELAYYGLIIGIAIIIGLLLTWREARRTGQREDDYSDYIIWGIIGGIIGARLYYVIFRWDYYSQNLSEIINLRSGGLAIYGTIIGAVLALAIFCRLRKKNFLLMVDTMVPQLALAQAMGRWGNFFNMEAFGGYTNSLFAMQLRLDKVNPLMLDEGVLEHVVTLGGVDYIQVHPTFLYESVWCLLLFIFLYIFRKRKTFNGQMLCLYISLYGIERAIVEGLRTDSLMIGNTGIRVSQVLAAACVAAGIVLYIILYRKQKKDPVPIYPLKETGEADGEEAAEENAPEEAETSPEDEKPGEAVTADGEENSEKAAPGEAAEAKQEETKSQEKAPAEVKTEEEKPE